MFSRAVTAERKLSLAAASLLLAACTEFAGVEDGPGVGLPSPMPTSTGAAESSGTTGTPVMPDTDGMEPGPDGTTSSDVADETSGGSMGGVDTSGGEESTAGEVQGCAALSVPDTPPQVCSTSSGEVQVSITNNCPDMSIELFWVDYACEEAPLFGVLAPGETFAFDSFDGHPWRIREAQTGTLLREITQLTQGVDYTVMPR